MGLQTLAASALIALTALSPQIAHAGRLNVFTSDASGFNTHSFWYDDGQEVTVIDAQFTPGHAQALLKEIREKSKSPVMRVIVTHPNPDKFNGLSAFHKLGIESVASKATASAMPGVHEYKRHFWVQVAKAFTDESYPKLEPVKTTYSGKHVIKLRSGETLTLTELAHPGISSNQTVVRVDDTGDLIVGDLVHTDHHAWLEGGIVDGQPTPSIAGWKADLNQLLEFGSRGRVHGGRGNFFPVRQAVEQQIAYLDKVDEIVGGYVQRLGEKRSELADPALQKAHFKAIQKEVANAFPTYAFPDMVGYSVYGLALQKVKSQAH